MPYAVTSLDINKYTTNPASYDEISYVVLVPFLAALHFSCHT